MKILLFVIVARARDVEKKNLAKFNKNCDIYRIANTPLNALKRFLLLAPDFADDTVPALLPHQTHIYNW